MVTVNQQTQQSENAAQYHLAYVLHMCYTSTVPSIWYRDGKQMAKSCSSRFIGR